MHTASLFRRRLLAASALVAVLATASTGGAAAGEHPEVGGRYLVVLVDTADPIAVATDHGRASGHAATHVYRHALRGYAATIPASRVAAVRNDARVAAVVEDRPLELTAKPSGGSTGETAPTGVRRVGALGKSSLGAPAAAVLDTGITPHVDLNVAGGVNCSTVAGTSYRDANGHGTHVAGTLAARANGTGVVGVAPGAPVFAVKILDDGGRGAMSNAACGIDWVTANAAALGITAVNMSVAWKASSTDPWTGPAGTCADTRGDAMHSAICRSIAAGVTYVASAGNAGADVAGYAPGAYPEVITVSALADFDGLPGGLDSRKGRHCYADTDDTLANFSNYGAGIDLVAPGVCIYSTSPSGGYTTKSGTSMAAPHVTGAALRYRALYPSATPAQIDQGLRSLGNTNWNAAGDPDGIKEPLLDVSQL